MNWMSSDYLVQDDALYLGNPCWAFKASNIGTQVTEPIALVNDGNSALTVWQYRNHRYQRQPSFGQDQHLWFIRWPRAESLLFP